MKRILSLIAVLALCLCVMSPITAAADTFVPSIGYKDGPEIIDAEMEDEDVTSCLVITSILAAEEKSTDITQEARDELLEVYEALSDGSMTLPLPECYVVRELVDINMEQLEEEGVTITVDFDLGLKAGTEIVVLVYVDDEWVPVETVVNGDGTVTCVFERFCPVAFCVSQCGDNGPAQTGDTLDQTLYLWTAALAVSLMGLTALLMAPVCRRKQ